MAMTKKEREAFAALEQELALARAWKLTGSVERDLPPPEISSNVLNRGWDFIAHTGVVHRACSSNMYHGRGWERTSSQRQLALFSTFERAKAALRYEVEREALNKLARIDLLTEPTD